MEKRLADKDVAGYAPPNPLLGVSGEIQKERSMIRALRWLKRSSSERRRTRIRILFGIPFRSRDGHGCAHSRQRRSPSRIRTAALIWTSAAGLGLTLTGCEWLPTRRPAPPAADRSAFAGPFYWTGDSDATATVAAATPWLLSNPRRPSSFPPFYPSIINHGDPALPEEPPSSASSPPSSSTPARRPSRPRPSDARDSALALALARDAEARARAGVGVGAGIHAVSKRERESDAAVDAKIVRASLPLHPPNSAAEPKATATSTSTSTSKTSAFPPLASLPALEPPPSPLAPTASGPPSILPEHWPGSAPRPSERFLFGAPDLDASALGTLAAPSSWAEQWRMGVETLAVLAAEPGAGIGQPEWGLQKLLADWLRDRGASANGEKPEPSRTLTKEKEKEKEKNEEAGAGLERLIDSIESVRSLEIVELRVCREVRGYADLELFDDMTFAPSQQVLIYCEMGGLRSRVINGSHHWRLETTLEVLSDSESAAPQHRESMKSEDHCARLRQDFFASYLFQVPSHLAPGKYRLRVTQRDEVGNQTDAAEIAFQVKK